ncbi:MAG: hypothetical protein HY911_07735 [Desulfobacterales bacterium]|nr:hypothetical protein [Desulfobacterales bacterium]
MKRRIIQIVMVLAGLFWLAGTAAAAEVSQGKCLQYDKERKLVTIEEYDINFTNEHPYGQPTGTQSEYNVATALIGIPPEAGDIIRLAYNVKDGTKVAIRLMNVSKQDLRKK